MKYKLCTGQKQLSTAADHRLYIKDRHSSGGITHWSLALCFLKSSGCHRVSFIRARSEDIWTNTGVQFTGSPFEMCLAAAVRHRFHSSGLQFWFSPHLFHVLLPLSKQLMNICRQILHASYRQPPQSASNQSDYKDFFCKPMAWSSWCTAFMLMLISEVCSSAITESAECWVELLWFLNIYVQ